MHATLRLAAVVAAVALASLAAPVAQAGHRNLCWTGAPDGMDCVGKLLSYMARETRGLDVIMYRWRDRRFSDRLVAKARAGLRVRVLADRSQYLADLRYRAEIDHVARRGVAVRIGRHRGSTHSKTVILHGRRQVVLALYHPIAGITNWEMHFAVQDGGVLRRMAERFERSWRNIDPQFGTFEPFVRGMRLKTEAEMAADPTVTCYEDPVPDPEPVRDSPVFDLCFSGDQNCQAEQLAPMIDREMSRLDVAIYNMSSSWMRDALVRFARTGRPLRLLVDGNRARASAMRSTLRRIQAAGPPGRVLIKADRTPRSMHLKMLVGSDWAAWGSSNYNSGSTVRVRGCQSRSYSENNLMVVRDRSLGNQAKARFDRLWASRDFATFRP